MVFGVGTDLSDIRVLRWRLDSPPTYVDAYGEDSIVPRTSFDFDWTSVGRDLVVEGRWPHVAVHNTLYIGITHGKLEFRIDDVVDGGRTVLSESLNETGQQVGELRVSYAALGDVLLTRVAPYRETHERFYVFNRLTRVLQRVDAVGLNAHRLPDDQGVVFPGGFHLANGETRVFATDADGFELYVTHRSPNGEDLLFAFHRPTDGEYLLLPYNVVNRAMATPVRCLGYGVFDDGTIAVLRDERDAQRVHPLALYVSPFCTPERYRPTVATDSFHGRIGNPELVRAIGEALSLAHDAQSVDFNAAVFEALVSRATRLVDAHAWLDEPEAHSMGDLLVQVRRSAGAVLDEFAAVAEAKRVADTRVHEAERKAADFLASAELDLRDTTAYVELLQVGRMLLGQLTDLATQQHVVAADVLVLAAHVSTAHARLGAKALDFLSADSALDGLRLELDIAGEQAGQTTTATETRTIAATVDAIGERVDHAHRGRGRARRR